MGVWVRVFPVTSMCPHFRPPVLPEEPAEPEPEEEDGEGSEACGTNHRRNCPT